MTINKDVLQKATDGLDLGLEPNNVWYYIGLFVKFLDHETCQTLTHEETFILSEIGLIVPNYETNEYEPFAPLFAAEEEDTDFDAFVDEYRKLFSKNSLPQWAYRSGIMGDKKMVAKKLKNFLKSDRVSKQDVLGATKFYIQNIQNGNIKFVHDADNFVFKLGRSALRAMIEEFKDNPNLNDDITTVI